MVSTFTGSIGQQLTTTSGGSNYSQTDSSPDWSIDDNAQELLNEAIASNYRSHENVTNSDNNDTNDNNNKQTGSKRKSTIATDKSSEDSKLFIDLFRKKAM